MVEMEQNCVIGVLNSIGGNCLGELVIDGEILININIIVGLSKTVQFILTQKASARNQEIINNNINYKSIKRLNDLISTYRRQRYHCIAVLFSKMYSFQYSLYRRTHTSTIIVQYHNQDWDFIAFAYF